MNNMKITFQLEELPDPYNWSKYRLTVTHDGYTEDGIRVHGVKELDTPMIIANAICLPTSRLKEYEEFL